jgi:hypothetical protein
MDQKEEILPVGGVVFMDFRLLRCEDDHNFSMRVRVNSTHLSGAVS